MLNFYTMNLYANIVNYTIFQGGKNTKNNYRNFAKYQIVPQLEYFGLEFIVLLFQFLL